MYASCLKRIRALLWDPLDEVAARVDSDNDVWAFFGDFNIIANVQEKLGGRDADLGAIQDFQECVMQNGLLDAGFLGINLVGVIIENEGREYGRELIERCTLSDFRGHILRVQLPIFRESF